MLHTFNILHICTFVWNFMFEHRYTSSLQEWSILNKHKQQKLLQDLHFCEFLSLEKLCEHKSPRQIKLNLHYAETRKLLLQYICCVFLFNLITRKNHLPPWNRYKDTNNKPNDVKKNEFKCNPNTSTERTVVTLSEDDTTNSRVMLLPCFKMKDIAKPTYTYN